MFTIHDDQLSKWQKWSFTLYAVAHFENAVENEFLFDATTKNVTHINIYCGIQIIFSLRMLCVLNDAKQLEHFFGN